jgi:hypothetical protein
VIDNCLADPWGARDEALALPFDVRGNFPGSRTAPMRSRELRDAVESHISHPVSRWPEDGFNCAYQLTRGGDTTWVHADDIENFAGVLFLTPSAPTEAGIRFYQHRETGRSEYPAHVTDDPYNRDAGLPERWSTVDVIGNVFNRLVLFPGRRFHAAAGYFGGPDKQSGRLTQTLFFSVEEADPD